MQVSRDSKLNQLCVHFCSTEMHHYCQTKHFPHSSSMKSPRIARKVLLINILPVSQSPVSMHLTGRSSQEFVDPKGAKENIDK